MKLKQQSVFDAYQDTLRRHFGSRLVDVVVTGEYRAVDDPDTETELAIAVILDDADWPHEADRKWLVDRSYDVLIDTGLHIRAKLVRASDWLNSDLDAIPHEIRRLRRIVPSRVAAE